MHQINAYNSTNTTNISLLSHALQRKILVIQQQCVGVCAARGGAGQHKNHGLQWLILNSKQVHKIINTKKILTAYKNATHQYLSHC